MGFLIHDGTTSAKDRSSGLAVALAFLSLMLVAYAAFYRQGRKLKRRYEDYAAVWPAMMRVWQSAMVCLRCHGAFFPPDSALLGVGSGHLVPLDVFQGFVADAGTRLALGGPAPSGPRSLPPGPQS